MWLTSLIRWFQLRSKIDTETASYPGSRSVPQSVSTWMMGIGLFAGALGPFVFPGRGLMLIGAGVFGIGLLIAVIQAAIDISR